VFHWPGVPSTEHDVIVVSDGASDDGIPDARNAPVSRGQRPFIPKDRLASLHATDIGSVNLSIDAAPEAVCHFAWLTNPGCWCHPLALLSIGRVSRAIMEIAEPAELVQAGKWQKSFASSSRESRQATRGSPPPSLKGRPKIGIADSISDQCGMELWNLGNDRSEGRQYTELLLKIIVVSAAGAGQTSIIRRYICGDYSEIYKVTIGADFASKVVHIGGKVVCVQLWDIASSERNGESTGMYYQESDGAIVVFDQSRQSTMREAAEWKNDLDAKARSRTGSPDSDGAAWSQD
jgi:hypothetical protein